MVLVTIIISRRIDRARVYISNWSVDLPAVRIVRNRGPYRPGRLGHGPYRLDTPSAMTQNRDKVGGLHHGRPEPTRGEERDGCRAGHSHPGIQPAPEPLADAD